LRHSGSNKNNEIYYRSQLATMAEHVTKPEGPRRFAIALLALGTKLRSVPIEHLTAG